MIFFRIGVMLLFTLRPGCRTRLVRLRSGPVFVRRVKLSLIVAQFDVSCDVFHCVLTGYSRVESFEIAFV